MQNEACWPKPSPTTEYTTISYLPSSLSIPTPPPPSLLFLCNHASRVTALISGQSIGTSMAQQQRAVAKGLSALEMPRQGVASHPSSSSARVC
eukprot:1158126-Pelagomonas_calceolata.AAC.10